MRHSLANGRRIFMKWNGKRIYQWHLNIELVASFYHYNHWYRMVVVVGVLMDEDNNQSYDYLGCHNVHVSVFTSLFWMLDAENFLIAGFSNIWTLPSLLVSVSHKMVNQWISIPWHLHIEPYVDVCYSLSLQLFYLDWMNGIKVVYLYSLDGFNWLFIFMKAVGFLVFFTYFSLCVCRSQFVTNMTINIYRY